MDPRLWGPPCWETLHAVTFAFPESNPTREDRYNMAQFFYSLGAVLPCYKCRKHFKEMLARTRIEDHLDSRESLTRWLVDRHNEVNKRLGKPVQPYEFVESKFSNYFKSSKCSGSNSKDSENSEGHTNQSNDNQKKILAYIGTAAILIILIALLIYVLSLP